jgi:hypothetical protein
MKTLKCSVVYTCLPVLMGLGLSVQAQSLIQFSASTYSVTEGVSDQAEVAVQRTNDLDTVVRVDSATTNLSATAGADYLDVSTHLIFLARETNLVVAVPILNDGSGDGPGTETVMLLGIGKPMLDMCNPSATITTLFDKNTRDVIRFQISGTEHLNCADNYPASYAHNPPPAREVARIRQRYALWFLNKHLKGSTNPMPDPKAHPRIINFEQK